MLIAGLALPGAVETTCSGDLSWLERAGRRAVGQARAAAAARARFPPTARQSPASFPNYGSSWACRTIQLVHRLLVGALTTAFTSALLIGCTGGHSDHKAGTTRTADLLLKPGIPTDGTPDIGGSTIGSSSPHVGQSQMTAAGATITVHAFENPAVQSGVRPAQVGQWVTIDAEMCAGSAQLNKTGYGFSLIDAEHHEFKADNWQQFVPAFPGTGTLLPGECTRGFVAFDVPNGSRVVTVGWEYPSDGGPFRWTVPAP